MGGRFLMEMIIAYGYFGLGLPNLSGSFNFGLLCGLAALREHRRRLSLTPVFTQLLKDLGYYMHDGPHGVQPGDWSLFLKYVKKLL